MAATFERSRLSELQCDESKPADSDPVRPRRHIRRFVTAVCIRRDVATDIGFCAGDGNLRSRDRGPGSEDCDDGEDDDCNGFTDEHDPACSAVCSGQQTLDADHDAVPDCADNCPQVANHNQKDYDLDGLGDACETGARLADINRSGRVDGMDLAVLGRVFGLSCDDEAFDRRADLTRDCQVDGEDLALLATVFGR